MWKPVAALFVVAGVICGSVLLFQHRHWLFRPDITRSGGTRLVLRVEGDAVAVAEALRGRLDPLGTGAVGVTESDGAVWLDVPAGQAHDAMLERVKRLGPRRGRLWLGTLADEAADAAAVKAARAWLAAPANAAARKACEDTATPPPPPAEGFAWCAITQDWASRQSYIIHGGPHPGLLKGVAVAAVGPDFVHHAYKTAGPRGDGWFVLVREAPDGERVGNADVIQVRRHAAGGPGTMQLHIRLSPAAATRRATLQRRVPAPARVTLLLDGEVVMWHQNAASAEYNYFLPLFESGEQAEETRLLIATPLPDGASAEIAEERVISPR